MPDPFISRQDLSDYIGRDVTADDGALIAVDAACDVVRTLTEQDFNLLSGDTATLDGTGTDTLLLPQLPVTAVGTVVVNGDTVGTADYAFTEEGYLVRTGTDGTAQWSSWSQNGAPASYWPKGRRNVTVTYDHGYVSGTVSDVPADVRMVALMIATRLVTQGVNQSEQIGQTNVRYAVASSDLTANEQRVLRKYKRSQ